MPNITTFDELLIILGALYLFECLAWLPWGALAASRVPSFFRRPAMAMEFPSNGQGGMAVGSLLPFGFVFFADLPALALSPEGVVGESACHPHPEHRTQGTGQVFRWDELAQARAQGRAVMVGGQALVDGISLEAARKLAVFLRRTAARPEAGRNTHIQRHLARSLRSRDAHRRALRWGKASAWPRTCATGAFLWLFAVVPAGEHGLLPVRDWLMLVAGFFAWHLAAAIALPALHRSFFPAQRGNRIKRTLTACLAPSAAMRSADSASHDLMAGLHPLAVAAGTCKPRAWRPLFGRIWRDAHHPLPPETADPAGRRILAWHRTAWREELGAFAKRHGIVEKAIAIAPEAPGESVRAYCPRCLSLFAKTGIRCDRCGGMPVSSVAA